MTAKTTVTTPAFAVYVIITSALVLSLSANVLGSDRLRYSINENWQFLNRDTKPGEKHDTPGEDWQTVSVPHTWNTVDTFDDEPGYRRGVAWYRKTLRIGEELRNKRLFVYFEGANQTAEVYCNERKLGRHIGGYSAFVFDVSECAENDRSPLLAVKVDNTLERDIPPLDADFTIYGGIYRDVWLVATNEAHFKLTDHASSGIYVETPEVSFERATVRVSGTVVNAARGERRVEVVNTILDDRECVVDSFSTALSIPAGEEETFQITSKKIMRPRLWSPDAPILYRVRSTITENGRTVDEVSNPLGFRWFRFDPDKGFFLNGKPLKLRGTNRHQDHAGLGSALPDSLHVRDLEIIKGNGFNFLRLAHYPQDPAVLEAADRLGLLIWEEIPIVNLITLSDAFNANCRNMLLDMIRQHRNHPSIILWGYMNEVFLRSPKTAADLATTVELAKELERLSKTVDPSRSTAIAFDFGSAEHYYRSGLAEVTDVVGWNLYFGWYHDTFADFGKFIDEQHRRLPSKPLILSEYGANADLRLHSLEPKRFDSTVEWQRMFHEAYLPQIDARPFLAGSAVWNQFDFGSEFRGETIPHLNQKGLFTYGRRPKDISYFYKASFAKTPVLHIAARDWQHRGGPVAQTIDVYTNLPQAELIHNGRSLGPKKAANRKVSWPVRLIDGTNRFEARAGRTVDAVDIRYISHLASSGEIAVNVGSNAEFVDADVVWAADRSHQPGGWGSVNGAPKQVSTLRNILGSEDDPLYQTMLEGRPAYRFDVPAGAYEIELRFAERDFRETGKRAFDVRVNGKTILSDIDLVRDAGYLRAFARKFHVITVANEGLLLEVLPIVGHAVLSAIRVKPVA